MRVVKKIFRILAWGIAGLLLLLLIFGLYVWKVSDVTPPQADTAGYGHLQRVALDSTSYRIGNNWLRKSESGLYEMYTSGAALERGMKNGKLSRELLIAQEEAFTHQIRKMIPSESYLKLLKYIVGFMNRDLEEHVLPEYQQEIYGISLSASDSFSWIGTNYTRQLNYHAAHDIGHALQNMMLVGCTSFGAWDQKTADGAMLLGRNFDFWVGDEFARNKIVAFVQPESGHSFAFITWGGFIGVVSGMNDQGLTVTINAAKSAIPTNAATPVSLVAREVLQYAATIEEAVAIAHKRQMFVSESFLIGSARDRKSVVVEKTPDTLFVYDPAGDHVICANHYQSEGLKAQKLNQEQVAQSASMYRYQRTQQLLEQAYPLTPAKVAAILRDTRGLDGADIGLGNEKAVNQLIAHHSIIFRPDSLQFWVSTAPWQLGKYVCYDLRKIFAMDGLQTDHEVASHDLDLPSDTLLLSSAYRQFLMFRKARMAPLGAYPSATFTDNNPHYYDAYRLAGDYWMAKKAYSRAVEQYGIALTKEIATVAEQQAIEDKLARASALAAGNK